MPKLPGINQTLKCAGVEPRKTTSQKFDKQQPPVEIDPVDVGNLQLSTLRRSNALGNLHYFVVVVV